MKATEVNATYKNLITLKNVLANVPGSNDKHRKLIPAHKIVVSSKTIDIPEHFRRGDLIEGVFVTRNIFLSMFLGKFQAEKSQKMLTTVTVVEKTDHSRHNKRTLILDIYVHGGVGCMELDKAEYILAIGTTGGDFPIPGTSKFVTFKKKIKKEE